MFVQLVYVSKPVQPMQEHMMNFIPLAQEKNAEHGVTGLIISGDGFYLQVLEGNRHAVNGLYRNIVKDERHEQCTLLRYVENKVRDFDDWSMAHTSLEELASTYVDTIVSPEDITPERLTAVKAMAMLRRISAHLRYLAGKVVITQEKS